MFAAWAFKQHYAFKAVLKHAILTASKDNKGLSLTVAGRKVREDLIPEGLCGKRFAEPP